MVSWMAPRKASWECPRLTVGWRLIRSFCIWPRKFFLLWDALIACIFLIQKSHNIIPISWRRFYKIFVIKLYLWKPVSTYTIFVPLCISHPEHAYNEIPGQSRIHCVNVQTSEVWRVTLFWMGNFPNSLMWQTGISWGEGIQHLAASASSAMEKWTPPPWTTSTGFSDMSSRYARCTTGNSLRIIVLWWPGMACASTIPT